MSIRSEAAAKRVHDLNVSIYDDLSAHPSAVFDIQDLEDHLNESLVGRIWDFPIRTRAKVAKTAVAEALGYQAPRSFLKTQPRFPGQNLDVFVQMSNNLQIWNEEVDASRRYAFIRVSGSGIVTSVRVVTGEAVALWDRTGTLTSKFQAKRIAGREGSLLVSALDTPPFIRVLRPLSAALGGPESLSSATSRPTSGRVLSIAAVFEHLRALECYEFADPGLTQERARGIEFQRAVCDALGLAEYGDVGQFPDILGQALEVKLQLSPTIDLGLVLPSSATPAQELGHNLMHRDARYAVAYASRTTGNRVRVDSIVVSTGHDFFQEFRQFEGIVQNRKLQIPLPRDLFDPE